MPNILRHIPNILTLLRTVIILPFLLCLYQNNYKCAFYLFLVAGLTDGLDGLLARYFNWLSTIGSLLDPLADKLLVAFSFISLALLNSLPWWLVVLVFLRDLTITLGVIAWYYFIKVPPTFSPTLLSKLNTAFQLALVTLALFQLAFFQFPSCVMNILIILTTLTTSVTYANYVWVWARKAYLIKNKRT